MNIRVKFTKEEKEEDCKDVEEMIRANMSYTQIAEAIGKSTQYVCDIKKDLVEKHIITDKEIKEIKEEARKDEEELFDELVLKLLNKGKKIKEICDETSKSYKYVSDAIKRLKDRKIYIETKDIEYNKTQEKIIELIKIGKCKTEISEELKIPRTSLERYIKQIIEDGKVKKEEIANKVNLEKQKINERNNKIYELLDSGVRPKEIASMYNITKSNVARIKKTRENGVINIPKVPKKDYDIKEVDESKLTKEEIEIIELLKKGYSYTYISKKIKINNSELMETVKKLKNEKYITQTIINEASNKKRENYLNEILKLLKSGYKQADIYRKINQDVEELTQATISRMIKELKDKELITDYEVKINQEKSEESYKSIDKKMLIFLKSGYTVKEIIELDETGYLTESRIRRSKKRLIESKQISESDIIKYHKDKEKIAKREENKKELKEIWDYSIKSGYEASKIANIMGVSEEYIYIRLKRLRTKKKISLQEFNKMRKIARENCKKKLDENRIKLLLEFENVKDKFKKEYTDLLPKVDTERLYISIFKKLDEENLPFEKEEIDILRFIFLYEQDFLTNENIKYVILKYLSINEIFEAEKLLNTYTICTKNKKELEQFRNDILILLEKYKINKNDNKKKVKQN